MTQDMGCLLIIIGFTATGLGLMAWMLKEFLEWHKDQDKPWATPLSALLFLEQKRAETKSGMTNRKNVLGM